MERTEAIQLKEFIQNQNTCSHKGNFKPLHQLSVPNTIKGILVLINTIICGDCGKQFVQTIDTTIAVSTMPNFK